jgi:hypothetical protein
MMKLPAQQQRLYDALAGNGDVDIDVLFRTLFDREPPKDAQQRLGPYIVKLNRRLAAGNLVVRPGRLKRTYSLQQL